MAAVEAPPRSDTLAAAPPVAADAAPSIAALDARGRLDALDAAFKAPPRAPSPFPAHLARAKAIVLGQRRRLAKVALGLAVVAIAGWMPVRSLLETTSTEAIINARLITLRAPIEGQVTALAQLPVGTELQPGAAVLAIANPRAERGRLDNLRQLTDEIDGDLATLVAQRRSLQVLHGELTVQAEAFRSGRMTQLQARFAELTSEIAAGGARREEADQSLARARALAEAGTGTKVTLERAGRDSTIARETLAALEHRRSALETELTALRERVYVGDSYNDRPQTLQRADDISLRLTELEAQIAQRRTRLASLRGELEAESKRYAERAAASIAAPIGGSIWEIMTAPGESVSRGQDLVRLLDCSGVVVTATVGETAYNHLRIGDSASFRFRGETAEHKGRIVGLTGVATAPANLAIQPAALAKEPYRVTVALPDLAKPGRCTIGRTGRVTFGR